MLALLGKNYSNVAVGSTSGSYSNSTTSFTQICSVAIITNGRPVILFLCSDGGVNGNEANIILNTSADSIFNYKRGSTAIGGYAFTTTGIQNPGGFTFVDQPSAGSYTYSAVARLDVGTGTIHYTNVVLVAIEL